MGDQCPWICTHSCMMLWLENNIMVLTGKVTAIFGQQNHLVVGEVRWLQMPPSRLVSEVRLSHHDQDTTSQSPNSRTSGFKHPPQPDSSVAQTLAKHHFAAHPTPRGARAFSISLRSLPTPITTAIMLGLTNMQPRQLATQLLNFALVLSTAFMLWKGLSVATDSPSPIVVVLSGSMEPAFQRGDLLFLWNRGQDTQVGEIVVYNVKGKDIPIVHRVVRRYGGG